MRKQTALAQEKHLLALHSVVESLRSFSNASRGTSETTPELLFSSELPLEDNEGLEHEPDFIATPRWTGR